MEKSQHTVRYRKLVVELKVARIRAGLTQAEAAEKLDTYPTYISKIEQGERRVDVIELAEICKVYGVTVGSLLSTLGIE